jgi:hypothetical protein
MGTSIDPRMANSATPSQPTIGVGSTRFGEWEEAPRAGSQLNSGEAGAWAIELEHVRWLKARQRYKMATIERGLLDDGTALKESFTQNFL